MRYKNEIIIFVVSSLFYLLFNDKIPITDPVEANYALTAKEMLLRSDYFNLIIYDQYWYDKPIFIYWSLLASYALFGINAFAARLPMALASGLTLSYLYWFVKRLYPANHTAWLAVAILATSLEYWVVSKLVVTDSFLFLFDGVALGAVYLALTERNRRWLYWAYGGAALAVLTKGPIGIVLPGMIILAFLLLNGEIKNLKFLADCKGILLFMLIALPWYIYMYITHGQDFIEGFLGLHNMTRAMVAEHPKDNTFFYYFIVFPMALFPWSFILARKIWQSLQNWRNIARTEMYLYAWIGVTIAFYTLVATKYLTYIYIALFPAAILIATYLSSTQYTYKQIYRDTIMPILLLIIGLVMLMIRTNKTTLINDFSYGYLLLLGLISLLVYLGWRIRRKMTMFCGLFSCNILLIVIATGCILPYYAQSRSSADLADYFPDNTIIASFGEYQTSLLVYHTGKLLRVVKDDDEDADNAVWQQKNIMPTQSISDFASALGDNKSVYVIVSKKNYEEFATLPLSQSFVQITDGARDVILKKR